MKKKERIINVNAIRVLGPDIASTMLHYEEQRVTARARRLGRGAINPLMYISPGGGYAGESQNKGRYNRKPRAAR